MENQTKLCPVCGSQMNRILIENKKNPRSPDWKCSDPSCKWKWNAPTGQYVPSPYVTGVWDTLPPQEGKPSFVPQPVGKQAEIKQMYNQKREDIREMHDAKQDSIMISVALNNAVELYSRLFAGKEGINRQDILDTADKFLSWLQEKLFAKMTDKPPFK